MLGEKSVDTNPFARSVLGWCLTLRDMAATALKGLGPMTSA